MLFLAVLTQFLFCPCLEATPLAGVYQASALMRPNLVQLQLLQVKGLVCAFVTLCLQMPLLEDPDSMDLFPVIPKG